MSKAKHLFDEGDDVPTIQPHQSKARAIFEQGEDVPYHAIADEKPTHPVKTITTSLVDSAVPFAASFAGLGKTAADAVTGTRGPLAGEGLSDLVDDYRSTRDEFHGDAKKAAEDNPKLAFGTGLAGGLKNPLFQGAKSIGRIAGAGAVHATGSGDADLTKGEVGKAAKDAAFGAGGAVTGYGVGKGIGAGITAAREHLSPAGRAVFSYLGANASGRAKKPIEKYITHTDEINHMIKANEGDVSIPSDNLRTSIQNGIRSTKEKLSEIISKFLEGSPKAKDISVVPLVEYLQRFQAKLNPNLQRGERAEIQSMMDDLLREADVHGNINLKSLYQIQNYLRESAKGTYLKDGQVFSRGKLAGKAAKGAEGEARKMLYPKAPEIKEANQGLHQLHTLEEKTPKNLIAPGTPESALMAAGEHLNKRNRNALKAIGKLIGQDVLGEAEKLAAARGFSNPEALPVDKTGKSVARQLMFGPFASPLALKIGINGYNLFGKVLEGAAKRGPESLAVTFSMLSKDPKFQKEVVDKVLGDEEGIAGK